MKYLQMNCHKKVQMKRKNLQKIKQRMNKRMLMMMGLKISMIIIRKNLMSHLLTGLSKIMNQILIIMKIKLKMMMDLANLVIMIPSPSLNKSRIQIRQKMIRKQMIINQIKTKQMKNLVGDGKMIKKMHHLNKITKRMRRIMMMALVILEIRHNLSYNLKLLIKMNSPH